VESGPGDDGERRPRRKYYVDGGAVEIAADLVYELDADGSQLKVVKYTDYTAQKVRTLYPNAAELRRKWADPHQRNEIIEALAERGIDFDELASASDQPDADPFDLLCHLAFNAPLRTRRERQRGCERNVRTSLTSTAWAPGRSWTCCWTSTPSTERHNS